LRNIPTERNTGGGGISIGFIRGVVRGDGMSVEGGDQGGVREYVLYHVGGGATGTTVDYLPDQAHIP
jgi:hypothetical protein